MRDAAGQMADRLHLLALPQRLLSLLTLLDLRLQAAIDLGQLLGAAVQLGIHAAEGGMGGAQHDHHQGSHRDEQADADITREPPREGFGDAAQIDGAKDRSGLRDRRRHHQMAGLHKRRRRPHGARQGVVAAARIAGKQMAVRVVDRRGSDLGIGAQGVHIFAGRLGIVESEGRGHAGGQYLRLDLDLVRLLRGIGPLVVEPHCQAREKQRDGHQGRHGRGQLP